jgi:hypothetical protein
MKTVDYLDAVKRRLSLESDYALAQHLDLTRQSISNLRGGGVMSATTAAKVAAILGLDPMRVIADAELERGSDVQLWRRLRDAAATVLVAIGAGLVPLSDAQARFDNNFAPVPSGLSARVSGTVYTLRARWRRFLAAMLGLLALSACAIDPHTPAPADWPRLEVRVHQVGTGEMLGECYATVPLWMKLLGTFPAACARIRFPERTCDIYCAASWSCDPDTLAHEREHCAGRDHEFESTLRDAWQRYKAAQP